MGTAMLLLGDTEWGHHMGGWGAGWWILMAFAMVVFWALVVLGVVWLVRSAAPGRLGGRTTALELLERRLASGEISPEEFRERKGTLAGEPPAEKRDEQT